MAGTNLFEQYGIKEVADVTIYELGKNGVEIPYLYLDSLKVSTIEQTAEQSEAKGGKGNASLIVWDYGKEINVTLEDALFSPKSMGLMFGGGSAWAATSFVERTRRVKIASDATAFPTVYFYDPNTKTDTAVTATIQWFADDAASSATASITDVKGEYALARWLQPVTGQKITVTADGFPGTYKIVGDTYARNRDTGKDEFFQFVINRAKMSAEETLTLEAEGDPTTFNLNLKVLRPEDGKMMELIQYSI